MKPVSIPAREQKDWFGFISGSFWVCRMFVEVFSFVTRLWCKLAARAYLACLCFFLLPKEFVVVLGRTRDRSCPTRRRAPPPPHRPSPSPSRLLVKASQHSHAQASPPSVPQSLPSCTCPSAFRFVSKRRRQATCLTFFNRGRQILLQKNTVPRLLRPRLLPSVFPGGYFFPALGLNTDPTTTPQQ